MEWKQTKRERSSRFLFYLKWIASFSFFVGRSREESSPFFCSSYVPPFHNTYLSKYQKKNWVSECVYFGCRLVVKRKVQSTDEHDKDHWTRSIYFCLYELLSVSGRQTRYTYTIIWRWTLLLTGIVFMFAWYKYVILKCNIFYLSIQQNCCVKSLKVILTSFSTTSQNTEQDISHNAITFTFVD